LYLRFAFSGVCREHHSLLLLAVTEGLNFEITGFIFELITFNFLFTTFVTVTTYIDDDDITVMDAGICLYVGVSQTVGRPASESESE
jgi:hypothetical protein